MGLDGVSVMSSVFASKIKRFGKRFLKQDEGAIAPVVGLSMLALCVAVGAAVDYGRVTNAQARLAASLDAAVIQVANQKTGSLAQLETIAKAALEKNYGADDYDKVSEFKLTGEVGVKLKASATVRVKTWFMSIVGYKYVDIPIASEAIADSGINVEVALVLDNTGSMDWVPGADRNPRSGESSRLTALKNAANKFIDMVVLEEQTPYFSKIALVPYAANVTPGPLINMARMAYTAGATCTSFSTTPLCQYYNVNKGRYTYGGGVRNCVTERQGAAYNTDDDMASFRAMPEYVDVCNKAFVKMLTSNKSVLHDMINIMDGNNGTAGHIGIQWGIQMLSPKTTLNLALSGTARTEAKPMPYDTPKLKKVMVIMTDGEFNHENCNGFDDGIACNNSNGDSLQQAAGMCNAAKGNGIEIYFINLTSTTPSNAVQTMMSACSSDASHIILANDAAALDAAFSRIAEAISTMRLSM